MKRNQLLRQIQEYDFAVNELTLYLNSHPTDTKALEKHAQLAKDLELLKLTYTKEVGPLTSCEGSKYGSWDWIQSPWPWENNCEVK